MSSRKLTTSSPEERLYDRIAAILDEARSRVARTVNTAMVHAYWLVGREIVEVEQAGKKRAEYGETLMKRVAERLTGRFGAGFSLASLKRMKQFFLAFHGAPRSRPTGQAPAKAQQRRASSISARGARGAQPERDGVPGVRGAPGAIASSAPR